MDRWLRVAERHAVVEQLMREDPAAMLEVTRGIIGKALDLTQHMEHTISTSALRTFVELAKLDHLIFKFEISVVKQMRELAGAEAFRRSGGISVPKIKRCTRRDIE